MYLVCSDELYPFTVIYSVAVDVGHLTKLNVSSEKVVNHVIIAILT
jgi:hypothetical protein